MAKNLKKWLGKYGLPFLDQSISEAQEAGEVRHFSAADIKSIADDVAHGNWMRLATDEALTGEWIIYAQHEGRNYYFCLGTHDISQHENLREQIGALCCQEFSFLPALFASA